MDEIDDVSQATAHVAIDVDKQTTLVHYTRLFNLGNYENEKIGVTLEVLPGQAVQDVIAAAEAEVGKQHDDHNSIRAQIQDAHERLWHIQADIREAEDYKERLLAEVKALEDANPEAVKRVQEMPEDPGEDDDEEYPEDDDDPEDYEEDDPDF